ncbi:MAG: S41 family peptidase [Anaerolineaceae bacterium]|jgi:carboxyl-terminal processing protease
MVNSTRKQILVMIAIIILMTGSGFAGGVVVDRLAQPPVKTETITVPAGSSTDFQLMVDAWTLIHKNYVDQSAVKDSVLTYAAISGMVDSLGDTGHSRFLSPDMVKSEQQFTNGSFEGIGAEVQMQNNHVVIVAPIDGSPAQKAGVAPGDIILKVDGVDMTGQSLEAVVQRILGPAGTKVTITLQNPETKVIRDLTITRAKITVENVTWSMIPGTTIAHIHISGFSNGVTQQLKTILGNIQAQGATGLILDLRNDPGGLLSESIGVTSQFLTGGSVLEEKDVNGTIHQEPVQAGGLAPKIPMVVLINQGTASAAEIVSGAIQDAKRAPLVGATTFGTGTVLEEFSLPDQSAMLLATQEWLTPKGRTIWHQGISPDQSISLPSDTIPLFPSAESSLTPAQVQSSGDAQLLKALQILSAGKGL